MDTTTQSQPEATTARIARSAQRLAWVVVAVAVALAIFASRYTFTVNTTPSLPIRVAVIERGVYPKDVGQLLAFRSEGHGPLPKGIVLVKRVLGMPGDHVRHQPSAGPAHQGVTQVVHGAQVSEQPVRRLSRSFTPLATGPTGRIPDMHYHVGGDHPDSFDSRYALMGWVRADQVVGTVVLAW
jgi:type IV secretory pathway protease TraF